jgi:16S rRNA processing protein RimM
MIRIGKIVATHGLQGGLILTHIIGASDWLTPGAVLFIELRKESYIPFFVASARGLKADEYLIQLEDVATVDEARKLVSRHAYVQEEILKRHAADSPLMWIGFNIVDRQQGGLGAIQDVLQTGSQWLARLDYQGREALIPLIDAFIIEVSLKNRFIRMDLPEGLLEL